MTVRAPRKSQPGTRITVGSAGIRTAIGRRSGEIPCSRVDFVAVTPDHVFFTGTNANGFAIPARAFPTPAAREEFIRLARSYHAAVSPRRAAP